MRKILFLGLLATGLLFTSGPGNAGEFAACEEHKLDYQELGVYGFCNAWHNAETDDEREHFETKFEERALFPPPWLVQDVCPCWSAEELDLICTQELVLDVAPSYYNAITLFGLASFDGAFWSYAVSGTFGCAFTRPVVGQISRGPLTLDQAEVCVAGVKLAVDGDLCPVE